MFLNYFTHLFAPGGLLHHHLCYYILHSVSTAAYQFQFERLFSFDTKSAMHYYFHFLFCFLATLVVMPSFAAKDVGFTSDQETIIKQKILEIEEAFDVGMASFQNLFVEFKNNLNKRQHIVKEKRHQDIKFFIGEDGDAHIMGLPFSDCDNKDCSPSTNIKMVIT